MPDPLHACRAGTSGGSRSSRRCRCRQWPYFFADACRAPPFALRSGPRRAAVITAACVGCRRARRLRLWGIFGGVCHHADGVAGWRGAACGGRSVACQRRQRRAPRRRRLCQRARRSPGASGRRRRRRRREAAGAAGAALDCGGGGERRPGRRGGPRERVLWEVIRAGGEGGDRRLQRRRGLGHLTDACVRRASIVHASAGCRHRHFLRDASTTATHYLLTAPCTHTLLFISIISFTYL